MAKEILKSTEVARPYEAVIIMHPDASADDQKTLFKKNKSIIESFGGDVNSLETWGKRTLANLIGKVRKAHFFHTTFKALPAAIAELERTMRNNDKVLRVVHTALDERVSLAKYMESFKRGLQESSQREKEKEAKSLARRQAAQEARGD